MILKLNKRGIFSSFFILFSIFLIIPVFSEVNQLSNKSISYKNSENKTPYDSIK